MERIRWIIVGALAALACHLSVVHTTPIDQALPFLGVAVTVLAALSYPSIMLGVPLLVAAEIAIPDEGTRLLAFGIVLACAVSVPARDRRPGVVEAGVPIVAILLLRWIPLHEVMVGRELFLLAIAVAIFFVLDRTPFAMAIAVVTALLTPAIPLRTLVFPIAVLVVSVAAKTFGMPKITLAWPSRVVVAFAVLFFAWSGVVARALPVLLAKPHAKRERVVVAQALAPRENVTLDVPDGARELIVSGAKVSRLRRGTLLGSIEPGGVAVRIGDAADWGYARRDQFYASRNPLPKNPAGIIRGYGYSAWLDGAGRIALPRGVRQIRVTADAALPPDAALQVEGFE